MWHALYKFARLRMFAKGWMVSPTPEEVRAMINDIAVKHPDDYILVIDFTQGRYEDRILGQNQIAVDCFGRISRDYGGFSGIRFSPRDVWGLFKTMAMAYAYPGHDFSLRMRWKRNCGHGPYEWFDTILATEETFHLLIERGRRCRGLLLQEE